MKFFCRLHQPDFQHVLTLEPGNKQAIEELRKLDQLLNPPTKATQKLAAKRSPIEEIDVKPTSTTKSTSPVITPLEEPESQPLSPKEAPSSESVKHPSASDKQMSEREVSQKSPPPTKESVFARPTMKVEIPKQPPKTSYEFETNWNSMKSTPDILYQYMKV